MLKSDLKNVNKMSILGTEKSNQERKIAVIQKVMKENNLLSFEELSSEKKKREKVKLPLKRVILKQTNSVNIKIIKTTMCRRR